MVAHGKAAGFAYQKVYGGNAKSCETHGPALVRKRQVSERIAELKEKASTLIELSKAQMLDQYAEAFMTPADKVKAGSRIIEGVEPRIIKGKRVTIFKLMSKVDAGREIAKMCGFYEPEKHNVTITDVNKIVRSLTHGTPKQ